MAHFIDNSLPGLVIGNLNIKQFSERSLHNHPLERDQIQFFLNKICVGQSENSNDNVNNEFKERNNVDLSEGLGFNQAKNRRSVFKKNLVSSEVKNDMITDRTNISSFRQSSMINGKSDNYYVDRRDSIIDLKQKKKEFISKQRNYLLKKSEYRTTTTLPRVFNLKEKDEKNEDVYKEMNDVLKEHEYVKKYLIPKETYSQSEVTKTKSKKGDLINVRLEDLLPIEEDKNFLKEGFTIKIVSKGNDCVYQVCKQKLDVVKNTHRTVSCPSMISNLDYRKVPLTDRIASNQTLISNSKKK